MMTFSGPWKVGLELELLAPAGRSRRDLAIEIAHSCGGQVKRIFYPQSEFALLEDATVFENLTLGFAIENQAGKLIAKCVDDLTIVDDLDATKGPHAGWYRILSDDQRFLSLVEQHCDASANQLVVLEPLAKLFGVKLETVNEEPLTRVSDHHGTSVAMAATLPGERHRPCELITTPMTLDRDEQVRHYLTIAEKLSFSVPTEAAIHIHFDGARLKSAGVMSSLIKLFGHYRTDLNRLISTNPNCRRLGDWPKAIHRLASSPDFSTLDWQEAVKKLRHAEPTKFCDFNIINLLDENSKKPTFEVRTLPGSMDAEFILRSIRLFEALLISCVNQQVDTSQNLPDLLSFVTQIGLPQEDEEHWKNQWESQPKPSNFGFLRAFEKLKK